MLHQFILLLQVDSSMLFTEVACSYLVEYKLKNCDIIITMRNYCDIQIFIYHTLYIY